MNEQIRIVLSFLASLLAAGTVGVFVEGMMLSAPWDLVVAALIGAGSIPAFVTLILDLYSLD